MNRLLHGLAARDGLGGVEPIPCAGTRLEAIPGSTPK